MRFLKRIVETINGLKYIHRFSFIGIVLGIPIIIMSLMFINDFNKEVTDIERQKAGIHYNRLLKDLLQNTQRLRGLSVRYLNGDMSVKSSLDETQVKIIRDYKKIEQYNMTIKEPSKVFARRTEIEAHWNEAESHMESTNIKYAITLQNDHIEKIINLKADVAEECGLYLAKTRDIYNLIYDVTKTLPLLTENLAKIRVLGIVAIDQGEVTNEDRLLLQSLHSSAEYLLNELNRVPFNDQFSQENEQNETIEPVIMRTANFLEFVNEEFIISEALNVNDDQYFNYATTTIDDSFDLYEYKTLNLEQTIDEELKKIKIIRVTFIILLLLALLISALYFIGFYYSIRSNAKKMKVSSYLFLYKYLYYPQIQKTKSKRKQTELKLSEIKKQLPYLMLRAQEEERKRVSRELHDSIGQSLYSIMVALDSGNKQLKSKANSIKSARLLTGNALKEVGTISRSLRPIILDDLGFISALQSSVEEYEVLHDIYIGIEVTGDDKRFEPEVETALYRICQEALTNTAKHAQASYVFISIHKSKYRNFIQIEDNGVGFDTDDTSNLGLGLLSMKERTKSIDGLIEISSELDKGTIISIHFPSSDYD